MVSTLQNLMFCGALLNKQTDRTHSSQTSRIYETRITTKKYWHNATSQVTALAPGGNIHINSIINLQNEL